MKELPIKIRHRSNTKEMWESVNPVLDMGEIGIEIPKNPKDPTAHWFFKFGNGINTWNELPWASAMGKVDPDLKISGDAADAAVTGQKFKELADMIEALKYNAMKLTLSIEGGATRVRTAEPPNEIKLTMKYTGAKPKENKATIKASFFDNYVSEIADFNGATHIVTGEENKLKNTFLKSMAKQTPSFTFTMTAKEEACPGNKQTEPERTGSVTLTFKDYVYCGYSPIQDATKAVDDDSFTLFLKSLNVIENFGTSKTELPEECIPDPSGEYYYFCFPYYYNTLSVIAGVTPLIPTKLGVRDYVYGVGADGQPLKISYHVYRIEDKYTSPIKISFTVS